MDVSLPLERWRYFVTTGLWPKRGNFDPSSWMSNFTKEEQPLALRLLEGFTFFSDELVRQMFRSAFVSLSQHVVQSKDSRAKAQGEWLAFIERLVVVRITGEVPRDADSGFTFARMARDILEIDESRIVSPEIALDCFSRGWDGNVLFVDDFVGSGNQFCDTWERPYKTGNGCLSFSDLCAQSGTNIAFYYCPVICTELGKRNIDSRCSGAVNIRPAHFYGARQSTLSADSSIWRDDMRSEGPEFVREASRRAGIPDRDGGEGCWRGFHKLGLALAFSHGYPDATVPLFYHSADGWNPLIKTGAL